MQSSRYSQSGCTHTFSLPHHSYSVPSTVLHAHFADVLVVLIHEACRGHTLVPRVHVSSLSSGNRKTAQIIIAYFNSYANLDQNVGYMCDFSRGWRQKKISPYFFKRPRLSSCLLLANFAYSWSKSMCRVSYILADTCTFHHIWYLDNGNMQNKHLMIFFINMIMLGSSSKKVSYTSRKLNRMQITQK